MFGRSKFPLRGAERVDIAKITIIVGNCRLPGIAAPFQHSHKSLDIAKITLIAGNCSSISALPKLLDIQPNERTAG